MKITLRLIISLLMMAALVASIFSFLQVRNERERLTRELEHQSIILAESLQELVKDLVRYDSPSKLKRTLDRFGNREKLVEVVVYDNEHQILGFANQAVLSEQPNISQLAESIFAMESVNEVLKTEKPLSRWENLESGSIYLHVIPLQKAEKMVGALALFYDASQVDVPSITNTDKKLSRTEQARVFQEQERLERERERFMDEQERRAKILAEGLRQPVRELFWSDSPAKLKNLVERFGNRDRLIGVAVYDNQGVTLASTPGLLSQIQQLTPQLTQSLTVTESVMESKQTNQGISSLVNIDTKQAFIYALPLKKDGSVVGVLALFHDASYIDVRLTEIWYDNFLRFLILALLMVITTVIVVRWSITGPIAQVAEWLKDLRMGGTDSAAINIPRGDILSPLTTEVAQLAKTLAVARLAEKESHLRIKAESLWTAERLKDHMRLELDNRKLFIISNREPYIHERQGEEIKCIIPAGGLVTALDPILRACGGVWVAHGNGKADQETADSKGRIQVPPDDPRYTLKRVWLSKEEEEGYYYGFSNEGIWPLCHITHTRPTFRLEDWIYYQHANEKFARALLDELKGVETPLVLIQDYQLALLPLLIKAKRPDARVAIFWHIPWPNAEVFGICPWKEELLLGLLGADLIGFHTQFHCNNFLETIERVLESKINWDQFSVERGGHLTLVKPFPISVAYPANNGDDNSSQQKALPQLEDILKELNVRAKYLGVGVDRVDYTKGIVERFQAVGRFFEKYPEFVGQFTFVELGAPSRTHIKRYRDLITEIEETVDTINWRFQTEDWKPIIFLKDHHSHEKIERYYKVSQLCMVTSLHDGMNLVAKEYIAAHEDEDGILILSRFTGASQELPDALIVNPYDIEEMADAIHKGLTMKEAERKERMKRMQEIIKERNVYRWAANLVITLSKLRMSKTTEVEMEMK